MQTILPEFVAYPQHLHALSHVGEVYGSPPTDASSPPTDHGPDLGCVTTSHINGRAGWWKSPCPDLARGRGGQPPGLLYNGLCHRPRMSASNSLHTTFVIQ